MKTRGSRITLPESQLPDPDPFSQEEVDLILKGFEDSYYLNFVKALLGTDCRPGELAALTWEDIRWRRNEIRFIATDGRLRTTVNSQSPRMMMSITNLS